MSKNHHSMSYTDNDENSSMYMRERRLFFLSTGIIFHPNLSFSEVQAIGDVEPSFIRKKKSHHSILPITSSILHLNWCMIQNRGIGLINQNEKGECLNICYINSVIQCLANSPPFAQWLLDHNNHFTCES